MKTLPLSISKITSAAIFSAVLLYTNSCGNHEPVWNPAIVPDTEYCGPACEHIGSSDGGLNCEEGKPIEMKPDACVGGVPDDKDCVSCKKFCEDTQSQGVWLTPKCVVNITACDQIDKCVEVKR